MESLSNLMTSTDLIILAICTGAAAIGGFLKMIIISYDFDKPHTEQEEFTAKNWNAALMNVFSRIIVAGFTGLVFGALLFDSIKFEKGPLFKLFALAAFIGYISPELWKSQEKRIVQTITKGVQKIVKEALNK